MRGQNAKNSAEHLSDDVNANSGTVSSRRRAKAMLTAGLKCAPEIGPNVRINTASMAPVAGRAEMLFLTTPQRHDVKGRASSRLGRLCHCIAHAADFFEPRLQVELIETADWQRHEHANPLMQHSIGVLERQADLSRIARGFGRIGNVPMERHRLTRPYRAGLTG